MISDEVVELVDVVDPWGPWPSGGGGGGFCPDIWDGSGGVVFTVLVPSVYVVVVVVEPSALRTVVSLSIWVELEDELPPEDPPPLEATLPDDEDELAVVVDPVVVTVPSDDTVAVVAPA